MRYLTTQKELTVYMPKKGSAFGQVAKTRKPNIAWQMTIDFLEEFTVYKILPEIKVLVEGVDNLKQISQILNQSIDDTDLRRVFSINQNELPSILQYIFNLKPNSEAIIGEVELNIRFQFLWRDFIGDDIQVIQHFDKNKIPVDNISFLHCYLSERKLFIQPELVFPCEWQCREFKEVMEKVYKYLPIKLKQNNFIRLIAKKGNLSFYGRKLPADWYESSVKTNSKIDWF